MQSPFNLTHLGGEKTVTGSCHLMQFPGDFTLMVDCGSAMGDDPFVSFDDMPVKPEDIDCLFITHAHMDHIGRIPELIEKGFDGDIICTHPTKALLGPMLKDGLSFSDYSDSEKSKLGARIDDLSWGFEYDEMFSLKNGITFKLGQAGHILGSCFIRFECPDTTQGTYSVMFSGDLGNTDTPILPDPATPDPCDLLILESTYGDRNHPDRSQRIEHLGAVLNKALSDQGKVYIPAFALGRIQELIYEIDRLKSANILDASIPVFIDSPLGLEITNLYSALKPFWDKEAKDLLKNGDHPLDFDHLYAVETRRDHQKLLDMPGPCIIIAGSGMLTGGRMVSHLEQGLANPINDVLFVGYQAQGTPGRDILTYGNHSDGFVRFNGHKTPVNAKIHQLSGYSAHSDQQGLIDFVNGMPEKPGSIKLVHGEPNSQDALRIALIDRGYRLL